MSYIRTPITFSRTERGVTIQRDIEERITVMDNLVELIAFTARGSFNGDPDFGLEYWNHEYANVSDTQFNNSTAEKKGYKPLKDRCQESIQQSIAAYAPECLHLSKIEVSMTLRDEEAWQSRRRKMYSHHEVVIVVTARMDDGMGTTTDYQREVSFMVEPTVRNRRT